MTTGIFLYIIELYLKKAGFQVYTSDGTSAMAAFHETKPSLVVLDILLPTRRLGRFARHPHGERNAGHHAHG
ncbi:MAG: hypothetical protein R2912_12490 [Eubacteriales bacterium]